MSVLNERERMLAELRAFVGDNYLYLRPDLELQDTDPLLELGIIDSLGFVELVEEVQTRYEIAVADVDITEENFGSIAAIAEYVARKRQP
ncbi:MAG: acyl carrier protein [Actinomycetota bacterium]|nr:acyl carrier protein [Actinomycetota bacterium]